MARCLVYWFAACLMCGCTNVSTDANKRSVHIGESKFRLVREVPFERRDLFELAIQAGMYTRKGTEYLPGAERGAVSVGGRTWHGSNGVGLVAYDPQMKRYSIYYLTDRAVPGHHLDIVYADQDFIFFTYGYHPDLPGVQPNLEIYSLRHQRFACLVSVSTRSARLGRFSMERLKAARPGMTPPQIGWNDQLHAGKEAVELSPAGLTRPDSMVLRGGVFELRYHESWDVEEFRTVLQFTKADIVQELDRQTSSMPAQTTAR